MKKKNIRKEFVEEIRKALPDDTNAAIYLTNLLGLGKETVYRRLRGTVPFTLDEAAQVARDLDISLDRLVGLTCAENSVYDLRLNYYTDFDENYEEMTADTLRALNKLAHDPSGVYILAANYLPYRSYAGFKGLSEFRYKRWLYERTQMKSFRSSDPETFPPDYHKFQNDIIEAFDKVENTYMIMDPDVFKSMVMELKYFRILGLIGDGEVNNMKRELLEMVDNMEEMMVKGKMKNGKPIHFYLSNVIFDTSYSYMETKDFQRSCFHVYAVHTIYSEAHDICKVQKAWLQTILRHSTLITQSGEIERRAFLKEQRSIIATL